jgi:hypothetical protein
MGVTVIDHGGDGCGLGNGIFPQVGSRGGVIISPFIFYLVLFTSPASDLYFKKTQKSL